MNVKDYFDNLDERIYIMVNTMQFNPGKGEGMIKNFKVTLFWFCMISSGQRFQVYAILLLYLTTIKLHSCNPFSFYFLAGHFEGLIESKGNYIDGIYAIVNGIHYFSHYCHTENVFSKFH